MLQKTPSRSEQALLFARNFLKHPRMLGSVIPSSRFLIKEIVKQIDFKRAEVIVEYGPGVGTVTTELLRRMRPDATLIVFETNGDFVKFMKDAIRDSRLHVIHGSAAEVNEVLERLGLGGADYVVSGIPYTVMPAEVREEILETTRDVLRPGGKFIVFGFNPAVAPHLTKVFGSVERGFEPLNILPAWLFFCTP